jgi:hypothetical protein
VLAHRRAPLLKPQKSLDLSSRPLLPIDTSCHRNARCDARISARSGSNPEGRRARSRRRSSAKSSGPVHEKLGRQDKRPRHRREGNGLSAHGFTQHATRRASCRPRANRLMFKNRSCVVRASARRRATTCDDSTVDFLIVPMRSEARTDSMVVASHSFDPATESVGLKWDSRCTSGARPPLDFRSALAFNSSK